MKHAYLPENLRELLQNAASTLEELDKNLEVDQSRSDCCFAYRPLEQYSDSLSKQDMCEKLIVVALSDLIRSRFRFWICSSLFPGEASGNHLAEESTQKSPIFDSDETCELSATDTAMIAEGCCSMLHIY